MKAVYIGIDCDVEKSGVSTIIKVDKKSELKIEKMAFFELFDYLKYYRDNKDSFFDWKIKIFLEAGWKILKSNWHVSGKGENVASRIGTKVGANHQVGKLIAEMCEYLGLECELVQPRTSKYSIKQFRMMSGYKGKLDQDMVDSALLIISR